MADVRPFRAVRYAEDVASDLGNLIAPPYDVTRPDLVGLLLERSPYNMVHLEHVRPDPGDDPHALAAARYRAWLRRGILRRDITPALYRYDHTFTAGGRRLTRCGIFGVVRLAAWDERVVLPHEGTFPGPVAERRRRLRAVRANLSPLYLLARDPSGTIRALLDAEESARPALVATDPDGEVHRLQVLSDPAIVGQVHEVCLSGRLYVADGHHRYEAALAYRDERRATDPPVPPDRPAAHDYVLALISDADDPSVLILPTHRLVRALPDLDPAALRRRLAEYFALDEIEGLTTAAQLDAATGEPATICLLRFTGETATWRLRARPGAPHAALLPAGHSAPWRALPTAILEHVILEHTLGLAGTRRDAHVAHTHDAALATAAVVSAEAQIAFLLPPSSVADLIAVADAGDRMPPKSTYFSPKVPAGLVIHDLAEEG